MVLPASASASLQTMSNLFVFGDSLSDGGNAGVITGGTYPPAPYYNNQFSNGPVAVEYLWQSYNGNAPFAPSLAGGTNYAVSGATKGTLGMAPSPSPEFGNAWQLQEFKQRAPAFAPASSLLVVWLFPNDVFRVSSEGVLPGTSWGVPSGPLPEAGGLTNLNNVSALIANGVANISYTGLIRVLVPVTIRRQLAQFTLVSVAGIIIRIPIITYTHTPFTNLVASIAALEPYSVRIGDNLALVVAVIVVMFWNFFVNRYWTYNDVN